MIKVLFNNLKIEASGSTEIVKFPAIKTDVFAGGEFFIDTRGADFVADDELVEGFRAARPVFVPNPDTGLVMEEFAAMAGGDGAKNLAAEMRFGVDEFGAAVVTMEETGLRGSVGGDFGLDIIFGGGFLGDNGF